MVSLDLNPHYLQKFSADSDLDLFRTFLAGDSLPQDIENDNAVTQLIFSLHSNDGESAARLFAEFSAKQPDSDSHFIYKDLQIFLFICVSKKFNLESEWLTKFLSLRKSDESEKNALTATFRNLLSENYESKENFFAVVIVYKHILGKREQNEGLLDETIRNLSMKSFPIYQSDFLNVVSIKASELIVLYKGVKTFNELENYRQFATTFRRRTLLISRIFCWLPFVLVTILIIRYSVDYLTTSGEPADFAGKALVVLAIPFFLLPFLGWTTGHKISEFVSGKLRSFLGYSDEM